MESIRSDCGLRDTMYEMAVVLLALWAAVKDIEMIGCNGIGCVVNFWGNWVGVRIFPGFLPCLWTDALSS